MPRRPVTFRQADLKRALAAAKAAKVDVDKVEIDPVTGKITMTMRGGAANVDVANPLDQWRATHARAPQGH
jgi:hypothetical protein